MTGMRYLIICYRQVRGDNVMSVPSSAIDDTAESKLSVVVAA